MTRNWHNPERPTPGELAAWVEGELEAADAARVEAWLLDHPDDALDAEASSRLVGLFRDHPPADPSPDAWDRTFARIAAEAGPRRRPWRWRGLLLLGLAGAAAVLACVLAAGSLWPKPDVGPGEVAARRVELPPEDDNDEPFPVAAAAEIDVLAMDPRDAGRLLIGHLLEPFVIASPEDEVELVDAKPGAKGAMPDLQQEPGPMIVARAEKDD
jgi:anti-sigma factor RsiW